MYVTPAGEYVRRGHSGPKKKVFDSEKEYRRFLLLRAWQAAGLISMLRCQVSFRLHAAGGILICRYRADFTYVRGGRLVVEDVKSKITAAHPVYRLKKKWLLAEHGIEICEV